MKSENTLKKFEETKELLTDVDKKFSELINDITKVQKTYKEKFIEASEGTRFSQFNENEFNNFLKEPYTIVPTSRINEWFVIVPKFIKMNIGWLDHSTDSYNVFKINKFANWLGEIPQELQAKFKFGEKLPLTVYDGMLLTGKQHQEQAWKKYNKFLTMREGKDKIKVKRGREFQLIASLLNDGILPFIPKPVDKSDLNDNFDHLELKDWQQEIWSRDYVQKALEKFEQYGAIGIYWCFSAGKSVFGSLMCKYIKGKKLVVAPTRMLVEQWTERLDELGEYDVDVITYNSYNKIKDREYTLLIFDECHRLPANTYSKLSTVKAKYRIGLSSTPYREDGRTDFIFALTGYPVGLDWNDLIKMGVIEQPDIRLFILGSRNDKLKKLKELIQIPKKTIIFCDEIAFGNKISKQFEIPFVYGQSTKRLEVIKEADVCVVSRVGDEGVSLPELERVIEIDFLFGSRRQEGQRMGRVFHGKKKGEHIILMTEEEYEKYEKRLYAIYEKGFKIEVVRGK